MEELLAAYPRKLLGEPLEFKSRQQPLKGKWLDLLFRSSGGKLVGIEVKRGPTRDKDVTQVIRYRALLKKEFPRTPIRVILVAPSVGEDQRVACREAGVEWKEVPEERFLQVAREHRLSTAWLATQLLRL